MGKTNLLDAVYYLSFCKSHINPVDSQIIRHDADVCMIQGDIIFLIGKPRKFIALSDDIKKSNSNETKRIMTGSPII
jgi:recombinational DNA repair ATPase RecF